jgi:hypothetical protein
LPPHVKWLGKISPADSSLSYNSQNGRLTWKIGELLASTGTLLPVKQVAFQVSITPGLANLGNLVELIGQSKATGHDDFVGVSLSSTDSAIDTNLPDDPFLSQGDGVVGE